MCAQLPNSKPAVELLLLPLSSEPSPHPFSYYLATLLKLAFPNTLTQLAWTLQTLIGVYYVGLLGNTKMLDGYSLACSWSGIFAFSILRGLGAALETFISQGFGKKDYRMCGLALNRSFLVLTVAFFPTILLMWMSGWVFRKVGIDGEVAQYAFEFTVSLIPSVLLDIPLTLLERFLLGQQVSKPQMVIQTINTALYPVYCQVFVMHFRMSFLGASVAWFISEVVYVAGMIGYIWYDKDCARSLVFPSKESFAGWNQYAYLAIPAMAMTCLEWWGLEIMNLLCGKLGVVELAANTIGLNYSGFVYLACNGIAVAAGTLVGNAVGEKNVRDVRIYTYLGVVLSFIVVLVIVGFGVFCVRLPLATLFSQEQDVVDMVQVVIVLVAVQQLFDSIQGTLARVIAGMGKQASASYINLVAYYTILLPVGVVAAFVLKLGIYGVWIAYITTSCSVCVGYSYIFMREDLEKLIKDADEIVGGGDKE